VGRDSRIEQWLTLVNRNVITMLRCCQHFAGQMRQLGRAGLLLVGSGGCYGGGSFMATYTASKAFDLCIAESLWAELRPHDVDVLYMALGTTDTPVLRALLAEKGLPLPPGVASPDDVATVGLARLPLGPVHNWGQTDDDAGYAPSSASARRARILAVDAAFSRFFGKA
jgi:short-subunit dehydrogenase